MKFEIKFVGESKARLGVISNLARLPTRRIETPTFMLYTQGGSVPHLTAETLSFVTTETHLLRIPIGSVLNYVEPLKKARPIGLSTFVGLGEHVSCLSVDDPFDAAAATKKHRADTVAVWSRNGRCEFDSEGYTDRVAALRPDCYFCLADDDTTTSSAETRLAKAVSRTISFVGSSSVEIETFATIAGGHARGGECADAIVSAYDVRLSGYRVDGFRDGAWDAATTATSIVSRLPPGKPRFALNRYDLLSVIELVEAGVDVFDSACVFDAVDRSRAFAFSLPGEDADAGSTAVDARDPAHRDSFAPLLEGCGCLACMNHTRAYVRHLLDANELLGSVLLAIHNLHRFVEFFRAIRGAIKNGKLAELKRHVSGRSGAGAEDTA